MTRVPCAGAWVLVVPLLLTASGLSAEPLEHPRPFFFALSVADVEESATWYGKAFGFAESRAVDLESRGVRIRLMARDGAFLELIEDAAARPLAEIDESVERRYRLHGVFNLHL